MTFQFDSTTSLDENARGVNFNPPGTPYQDVEDSDMDDTYPAVIKGLVYVSGDASTSMNPAFEGIVVAGNNVQTEDTLNVQYDSLLFDNPPPGFHTGDSLQPVPGTWGRGAG